MVLQLMSLLPLLPLVRGEEDHGAWPPANMTYWPDTRVAALAFDGVVVVVVIVILLVPGFNAFCCQVRGQHKCCVTIQALLGGFVAGLFIHFIPCIWWTCDWGDYDGEGVRGGILFAVWAIVAIVVFVVGCRGGKEEVASQEVEEQLE
eukprot:Hpha_TRINITY_DN23922_c0_g1::TRINITY_DN23922_c0_g1_i1::g.137761::m.137761